LGSSGRIWDKFLDLPKSTRENDKKGSNSNARSKKDAWYTKNRKIEIYHVRTM
jgi:hypothetical protein